MHLLRPEHRTARRRAALTSNWPAIRASLNPRSPQAGLEGRETPQRRKCQLTDHLAAMDIQQLCAVLAACVGTDPNARRAAEEALTQVGVQAQF